MPARSRRQPADPFGILGVSRDASADEVRQARNRLAKEHHPDVGGNAEQMQRVNDAAAAALRMIEVAPRPALRSAPGRIRRDHPSFTIEALPADAFEALLIVANVLGQIADDEPPYRLEVLLDDPGALWCGVEVVPDGGGSTVSLTVAGSGSVTTVRDRFVDELNALDWTADGPRLRLPS